MYVGNAQRKPGLLLNNAELAVVVEVRYLGVTVDSRLTFDVPIRQTVARAFVRDYHKHKYFVSHDIFYSCVCF